MMEKRQRLEAIKTTFQQILDKMHEIHPNPESFRLLPALSLEEIEARESEMLILMSDELKAMYQVCGGQEFTEDASPLFYDMMFMSLDDMSREVREF